VTTQHIGAAGELLVQYQLLKLDIDSARLTTDAGVDLVVYSPTDGSATTVQVKTQRTAGPSGGRGRHAIGWSFPHDSPADMLAVALLERDLVWIFTLDEARFLAQQHPDGGARRLYWYVDPEMKQRNGVPFLERDVEEYLLERRAASLFLGAGPRP
jgi:hypothetical protein